MKILIVTPYFYPENFKINDLSNELYKRGHDLSIITPIPNYPEGSYFEGYSIFKRRYEIINGKNVYRVPVIPRGKGGIVRLSLNYISFVIFCVLPIIKIINNNYDIIFVYSPSPATVGLPAVLLKKIFRIPLICWIHDLWPESVKYAGGLKTDIIPYLLLPFIKIIYNVSDKILVSSRGFINAIVDREIKNNKIHYFPQWAENIFKPILRINKKRSNVPEDSFIIMFAGNIGEAQDFDSILKTAIILKENKKIQWIILGSGRKQQWVKKEVNDLGLSENFHLMGRYPLEAMPEFYSQADVMLLPLKKEEVDSLTIPAKIQSYLACGKPVLGMLDGEGADIINESGAGLTCPAGTPKLLARNILQMYSMDQVELNKFGDNAITYYTNNFDRNLIIDRFERLFQSVIA